METVKWSGENFYDWRVMAGFHQEKLARKIGCAFTTIRGWELGKKPRQKYMEALAKLGFHAEAPVLNGAASPVVPIVRGQRYIETDIRKQVLVPESHGEELSEILKPSTGAELILIYTEGERRRAVWRV